MNPAPASSGILIAFGGNALSAPADASQKEEFTAARSTMEKIADLLQSGHERIIITHGNGPQVGRIFLQQELTRHEFPRRVTLDVCVADSQGRIGYILQNVFDNVCAQRGIGKRAFTVITQVAVAADDPAFKNPSKPIGLFYTREQAEDLTQHRGWVMKEDAGRGYRRVVPSPAPLDVIEKDAFIKLLDLGFVVIGAGGGGIPVVCPAQGGMAGVEAVIDKDLTSALLANSVGVERLVILTCVDFAYLDFNTRRRRPVTRIAAGELEKLLRQGHFAAGSMQPKVEAAIRFVRNGGKEAIIAHLQALPAALAGKTGTHVFPG